MRAGSSSQFKTGLKMEILIEGLKGKSLVLQIYKSYSDFWAVFNHYNLTRVFQEKNVKNFNDV